MGEKQSLSPLPTSQARPALSTRREPFDMVTNEALDLLPAITQRR